MTQTGVKALLIVMAVIIVLSGTSLVVIKGRQLRRERVPLPSPSPAVEVLPAIEEATPVASPTATPVTPTATPAETATPSARRVEVIISNFAFQPNSITTGRGSTIVWTNNDTVDHTVTASDGSFDSGTIVPGDTFEQRFDKIKSYTYSCGFHPEMKGTITIQ